MMFVPPPQKKTFLGTTVSLFSYFPEYDIKKRNDRHHHNRQVLLTVYISPVSLSRSLSLSLFRNLSLSSISLGRSSKLDPVSAKSWCKWTLARACVVVHRRSSFLRSSLFLQQVACMPCSPYCCGSLTHLPIMDSSHRYWYRQISLPDQSRSEPLQLPSSTSAGRVICGTDLAECVSVPGDFLRPQGASLQAFTSFGGGVIARRP